jgi:hypothetical protein
VRENGFVNPILVDRQGNVIAGHGRILAAQQIGLAELPVIVLDHLTETQVQALRIADNRIAQNGGWDDTILQAELNALLAEKVDLTSLGFAELELKRILAAIESDGGSRDDDTAPEPPDKPITKIGDLWKLGDHRLLCGDSTSPKCLDTVLDGRPADLIYADPPYNVAYGGSPRISDAAKLRPILNDDLKENFSEFLQRSCLAMLGVAGGAIYISMGSSELHTLHKAFTGAGGH